LCFSENLNALQKSKYMRKNIDLISFRCLPYLSPLGKPGYCPSLSPLGTLAYIAANLFTPRVPQVPNNYNSWNLGLLDSGVCTMVCCLGLACGLYLAPALIMYGLLARQKKKNVYPKFCNHPRCLRNRYTGDCRATHIQTRIIDSCIPALR